ncbi:PCP reductase family protein [Oscillatoriales cyanobacterium LEGE 11467]|uniref:PCP reductase family protein n=1 Tax=Zarconia navalis LEGE 11467 TaxID=1828826 RepID=A0A928VWX9_9CYAN|nr:PCP reductase family protein [Zarconia navalis]MBE9041646.1 PCP reductase family protein [Zarconia navalis LEGE 11467]
MLDSELTNELQWTSEARAKLRNIPFFARARARTQIEELARRSQSEQVTVDIVEEARQSFGQ